MSVLISHHFMASCRISYARQRSGQTRRYNARAWWFSGRKLLTSPWDVEKMWKEFSKPPFVGTLLRSNKETWVSIARDIGEATFPQREGL
jgi:hypothetical protein